MAQKNAFLDPVTNRLKCWGYIEANEVGDIKLPVSESFNLDIVSQSWQWNGAAFVPYIPPPRAMRPAEVDRKNMYTEIDKELNKPGLAPPTLTNILLLSIRKGLRAIPFYET